MHKECAGCGNLMYDLRRQLCFDCVKKYGVDKSKWPEWLIFSAKNIQDEWNKSRNHDDLPLYDESLISPQSAGRTSNQSNDLSGRLIGVPQSDDDEDYDHWGTMDEEYDEWGNRIETIDGFNYVDIDRVIDQERQFNRHLRALSNMPEAAKAKYRKKLHMQ